MPLKKLDRLSRHKEDSQDEILGDDSDVFKTNSNPTLSLEIEDTFASFGTSQNETYSPASPGCVSIESDRECVGYINFEVISTDRVKDGRNTYVVYKILITGHGIEKTPGIVEKRYSDLEKLNAKLHKKFPELLENVSFPGKVIVGNFKPETIAKRSRAFEQYLNHLMSINEIRFSSETREFFYGNETNNANNMLKCKNYPEAIGLLEKCLPVQEKLLSIMHDDVIQTLCSIIACYQVMGNLERALYYSKSALICIGDNVENSYYLPLIHTAIYIHWMLGIEKSQLEAKLGELKDKGVETEANRNLMDAVMKEIER